MGSERLRAAGSMSGMVDGLVSQQDAPECFTAAGAPSGTWSELLCTLLLDPCHLNAVGDSTLVGACQLAMGDGVR